MTMTRAAILAALLLATNPAHARWYAIDGDTIVNGATREHVRVENIDAPELRSYACRAEYDLAIRAKDFVGAILARSEPALERMGTDRYGRTIARVTIKGRGDLGQLLIGAGLAREYHGKIPRKGWC